MIDVIKYQIPNFEKFEQADVKKQDLEIRFATHIAVMYHEFAYYQMINFCKTSSELFEQNFPNNDPQIDTYLYKAWSSAFGIYALMRTVIEAVRKINDAMLKKNSIAEYYQAKIKKIIDITNDIVKHPMFNGGNSRAYLPIRIGRGGEIDIQEWIDKTNPSSGVEIYPEEDFYFVCNYLEYIAGKLKQVMKK